MARVGGAHHVLGVEALGGELRHGERTVLLGSTRSERGEADHEEVETRVGDQVDGNLSEIAVELTRESERAGGARDGGADQVVQVTICGGGELECAEADVIESLIVDAEGLVSVLANLVHGEGAVVWLNDRVGHLGGRHDGVGGHDSVWVLLADLGDEESAHARARSSAEGVGHLEALHAVAALSLLADDVEN